MPDRPRPQGSVARISHAVPGCGISHVPGGLLVRSSRADLYAWFTQDDAGNLLNMQGYSRHSRLELAGGAARVVTAHARGLPRRSTERPHDLHSPVGLGSLDRNAVQLPGRVGRARSSRDGYGRLLPSWSWPWHCCASSSTTACPRVTAWPTGSALPMAIRSLDQEDTILRSLCARSARSKGLRRKWRTGGAFTKPPSAIISGLYALLRATLTFALELPVKFHGSGSPAESRPGESHQCCGSPESN